MASSLPWGLLVAVPENQSLIILVHFPEAFKTEIEMQVLAGERKGATGRKGSLEKSTCGIYPVRKVGDVTWHTSFGLLPIL